MARNRSDPTVAQLRYFVAVAAQGSMTEAAADLRLAQSAVSAAIAQLERSLGVQLFIRRHGRGLVPTEAGELLLREARSLLAQLEELTDSVRGQQHEVRGTLRLGCFVTLAPFLLPRLISRVQEEHPQLRVEVIEADADGIAELVLSGTAEGAIAYDFGGTPGLTFRHLYSTPPHVVVSADHPLAHRKHVALGELAGEDLVLLDMPHSREYFLGILASAGLRPPIRYSSRSYETVRSLVARGHGYSILNHAPTISRTYDGGRLRALRIADEAPSLAVSFVRADGVRPSARTRVIEHIARELFGAG